jgi:uncharacterized protein (DUF2384 family)
MEKLRCSYCGKDNVSIQERGLELSEPYGGTSIVKIKELVCSFCGFAEEADGNDLVVQNGLSELKRTSMIKVLETLNKLGHSNASMERALGLPTRTLARWKNEKSMSPSASGIALMRIIRTFPWILDVAEFQFDSLAARSMLLAQAAKEIVKTQSQNPDWTLTSSTCFTENYRAFHIEVSKNTISNAISGAYQVLELSNSRCIHENQ